MNSDVSFGRIIKERRRALDLTQAELARRVACATITIRKIEADALRPSRQIAERLAMATNVPLEERAKFVRLARLSSLADRSPPLPTPPPAPEEIGGEDLSGRAIRGYELGERIGSGGFGAVYRAVQPVIEREVAIKIVLPQYADHPDFIRRFEAEAQLVARLEHPYIVPLYDYWREPGVAYLVMRLLRGGSLTDTLKRGPLALQPIAVLLEQIGAALHAAHRMGVIHRDLKPANVLLDEDGNGYLADFGIAKNLSDPDLADLTQAGMIIGSPAYSSPEQILSEPVMPQADIYCLGLLLYEMLTGERPFRGPTPIDYVQQHLNEALPPLEAYPELDPVIRRATAKQPLQRYPDIPGLLADFRRAAAEGVAVAPSAVPYAISAPDEELENPYKGLRAFSEADAGDFFGRDTLVQELLGRMAEADDEAAGPRRDLGRFLAVVGPSGSGKSSVVKAGLIPALRQGGLPGSEKWFVVDLLPGAHPFEELEAALLRVAARNAAPRRSAQEKAPRGQREGRSAQPTDAHSSEAGAASGLFPVNPPESLLTLLQESERGLLRAVRRVLPADPEVELVLVIDQFEEVFTQVDNEAVRDHLLESLVAAALEPRSRLRLVVTLRADFTGRALEYVDFGELLRQRAVFVLPLTAEEVEQAVLGPAAGVGVVVEPGLLATIVGDVGDQPGMLPLLQYALTELFERREVGAHGRASLTLAAYRGSGGVMGALAGRAEELYARLGEGEQEACRQLFLRLVTLGEGVEDTRRRVLMAEVEGLGDPSPTPAESWRSLSPLGEGNLAPVDSRGDQVPADGRGHLAPVDGRFPPPFREGGQGGGSETPIHAVLDLYGRYRLLTFDHDPITRGPTVEVAHEALLREWGRLRGWLESSRADVRLQRLLATAAGEWDEAGKESSYLLRGARLAQYEGWAEGSAVALTGEEWAYLEASLEERGRREAEAKERRQRELETALQLAETEKARAEAERQRAEEQQRRAETEKARAEEQAQTARRLRRRALVLAGVLAIAVVLAIVALLARRQAVRNERVARSRELAASALNTLEVDPELSVLLALQAVEEAEMVEAVNALHETVSALHLLHTLGGGSERWQIAVSPDGARLIGARWGGELRVWETASGREVLAQSIPDLWPRSIALSPDGTHLAAGGADGTVRVWRVPADEATAFQELLTLPASDGWVNHVAFSPDGMRLASAGEDGIKLWDIRSGEQLLALPGHAYAVDVLTRLQRGASRVAFSPDGTRLASGGADGTVRLWDLTTPGGRELLALPAHAAAIHGLTLSSDRASMATSGPDATVKIWDLSWDTAEIAHRLTLNASLPFDVAFSPDGAHVAVTDEGPVYVWDAASGEQVQALLGHTGLVRRLAYSPDGTRLFSAADDNTVKVWDLSPDREVLTLAGSAFFAGGSGYSPDGTRIVAGFGNGQVIVYDSASGQALLTLDAHAGPVGAGFSPDGTRLGTLGFDGTAKIWDAVSGQELLSIAAHSEKIVGGAFSPDGTRAATASNRDNIVRVWDLRSGEELLALHHDGLGWGVSWSPDGAYLATSSGDGTARVWDATSGQELLTLADDPTTAKDGISFSPDGERLAVGDIEGTVIVWDVSVLRHGFDALTPAAREGTAPDRGEDAGGAQAILTLRGHTSYITSIFFSPDGTRLASASGDGTARVWDATSGQELLVLSPRAGEVLWATFSPDSRRLLVSVYDGTVRVYTLDLGELVEIARSRLTRSFTEEECRRYLHLEECP